MDESLPKSPGAIPLDLRMKSAGVGSDFDAAVVAWDLYPEWDDIGAFCRWEETLRLMRLLARSTFLPEDWRLAAERKHFEYSSRTTPGARRSPLGLGEKSVFLVCMEPEFEDLLTANETGVKRVLEIQSRPKDWPRGWGGGTRAPSRDVMQRVIGMIPPRSGPRRTIKGGWRQSKNEWAEYIVRRMAEHERDRERLRTHPLVRRLAEMDP